MVRCPLPAATACSTRAAPWVHHKRLPNRTSSVITRTSSVGGVQATVPVVRAIVLSNTWNGATKNLKMEIDSVGCDEAGLLRTEVPRRD